MCVVRTIVYIVHATKTTTVKLSFKKFIEIATLVFAHDQILLSRNLVSHICMGACIRTWISNLWAKRICAPNVMMNFPEFERWINMKICMRKVEKIYVLLTYVRVCVRAFASVSISFCAYMCSITQIQHVPWVNKYGSKIRPTEMTVWLKTFFFLFVFSFSLIRYIYNVQTHILYFSFL